MKFATIVWKNLLQLFFSKRAAVMIVLGPLLLILLVGLALQSAGTQDFKAGLHINSDVRDDVRDLVEQKLREKSYSVSFYSTLESCVNSVKSQEIDICVQIRPRKTSLSEIDPRAGHEIVFHADFSRVGLVWAVVNTADQLIGDESRKLGDELISQAEDVLSSADTKLVYGQNMISDFSREAQSANQKMSDTLNTVSNLGNQIPAVSEAPLNNIALDVNVIQSGAREMQSGVLSAVAFLPPEQVSPLNSILTAYVQDVSQISQRIAVGASSVRNQVNSLNQEVQRTKSDLRFLTDEARDVQRDFSSQINDGTKTALDALNDVQETFGLYKNIRITELVDPIPRSVKNVVGGAAQLSARTGLLNFLLPSILVILILFDGVLIGATMMFKECNSFGYLRGLITPTNKYLFVASITFVASLLIAIQLLIVIFIARGYFGANINSSNVWSLIAALALIIGFFVNLGIILSMLFKSEEGLMATALAVVLSLLLFSSFLAPQQFLSPVFSFFVKLNPVVFTESLLRKIIIFELGFAKTVKEFFLTGFVFVASVVGAIVLTYTRRQ